MTQPDGHAPSLKVSAPADTDLTSRTLFKLIVLHNFIIRPFTAEMGKKYGLALIDWRVLFITGARPGITGTEIGDTFGFEKMAVSRAIARLAADGKLERLVDPTDRRRGALRLSAAGEEFLREVTPIAMERDATLEAFLSPQEHAMFDETLTRLIAIVRERGDFIIDQKPKGSWPTPSNSTGPSDQANSSAP